MILDEIFELDTTHGIGKSLVDWLRSKPHRLDRFFSGLVRVDDCMSISTSVTLPLQCNERSDYLSALQYMWTRWPRHLSSSLVDGFFYAREENVPCQANHSIAYWIPRTKEGQLHRIEFLVRSAENQCECLISDRQ